jgi:3-hydroxyisobutyrate dehydrogenase-like beta-hydroxyacid dehydrogenase
MAASIKDVGVIGLGIIGSRVAEHLRRTDHNVFVWSRSSRAVPNFMASPREVAEVVKVVQIFVRDAAALLEAVNDMRPALKPYHIVCCNSTVSLDAVKEAADILSDTGAIFLDAPFTGSKMAAEKGELAYYVSGEEEGLRAVQPVLEVSSKSITRFGNRIGDATVLKIATNLVSSSIVTALAEAASITQHHGVSLEKLAVAFQQNANNSGLIQMKLPAMMNGDYAAHFSLRNMLKDARYGQELARAKSLDTPVIDTVEKVMEAAEKAGCGDDDFSVVAVIRDVKEEKKELKVMGDGLTKLKGSAFDSDKP